MQTGRIILYYRASDGASLTKIFKTLAGAQAFAHKWVGPHPEMGQNYAVSFDGVGTVRVIGKDGVSIRDLFPEPQAATSSASASTEEYPGDDAPDPDAAYERHLETRYQGTDAEEARAFGHWEDAQ